MQKLSFHALAVMSANCVLLKNRMKTVDCKKILNDEIEAPSEDEVEQVHSSDNEASLWQSSLNTQTILPLNIAYRPSRIKDRNEVKFQAVDETQTKYLLKECTKKEVNRLSDEIDLLSYKIKKLEAAKETARRQSSDEDDDRGMDDVRSVSSHRSIRHASHRRTYYRTEDGKLSYHDQDRTETFQRRCPNNTSVVKEIRHEYLRLPPFEPNTCVESYLAQFETCARFNKWTKVDQTAQLKMALKGASAQILWDRGGEVEFTLDDLIRNLKIETARWGKKDKANVSE